MNDSALFEQIVGKLRLKSDMTHLLVGLEELMGSFFNPQTNDNAQHAFDKLPSDLSEILRENFLKEPITPENQKAIKSKIDALETKIRACKYIEITVAFQPGEDAVVVFSDWVKKNLSNDTLIDLKFDKSIVGGALLVAGGKYKDYSIRKKLAGRFQIQRDEIEALLT